MESRARHYLDHAATSWPKPPGVLEACLDYQKNVGSAAGRGVYQSAEIAAKILLQTRACVAELIGAENGNSIAFCSNGTLALNAAIQGLLNSERFKGTHVVTTATEHNSVLRPLSLLKHRNQIEGWTAVPCDHTGRVDPSSVQAALEPNTKLIIVNHASNVTGSIQDIDAISEIAGQHGAVFMIDAAQTLGYVPINVQGTRVDLLAAPGHKGLGGMLGTGILYASRRVQEWMSPVWIGGTGTHSDSIDGPFDWLSAVESGNINLPAIASLRAGVEWTRHQQDRNELIHWMQQICESIHRSSILAMVPQHMHHVPVVSMTSSQLTCHELALMLDSAFQIEVRSGFHCAGLIHKYLKTDSQGGTLRMSLGHTSMLADVEAACSAIESLGDFI